MYNVQNPPLLFQLLTLTYLSRFKDMCPLKEWPVRCFDRCCEKVYKVTVIIETLKEFWFNV